MNICRWAGETEPRVIFRNIVQRPRHKATGTHVFFCVLSFCLVPEKVAESKKNWAFTCLMDLHEQ